MLPDIANGLFEFTGSAFLWYNVYILSKQKQVRGVHWGPTFFFFSWGIWNLYYYPHLNQIYSFLGGLSIVVANGVWFGLMLKYRKN